VQTPLPTIAPPSPTSPFGIFYGMVAWLADMFMKNMYLFLIVAAIAVAFYVNRRRKGRDPLRFK
jgi:high-affinity Fe2+/Pb2+ permease